MNSIKKTFTSKKGNSVVFRYPAAEDLESMLEFANALIEEDTFIELSGDPLTLEHEREVLDGLLKEMEVGTKVHIVATVNGKYAGNAEIRRQKRRKSHTGEIGIALLKEFRQEGIGTELIRLLIEEARALGLKLLILNSFETNNRALHVYEKLGFKTIGVIPGAIAYKDNFIGEVKMYLDIS